MATCTRMNRKSSKPGTPDPAPRCEQEPLILRNSSQQHFYELMSFPSPSCSSSLPQNITTNNAFCSLSPHHLHGLDGSLRNHLPIHDRHVAIGKNSRSANYDKCLRRADQKFDIAFLRAPFDTVSGFSCSSVREAGECFIGSFVSRYLWCAGAYEVQIP